MIRQNYRRSLAFRIVVACGALGAVLSMAFALSVFVATQIIEDTLVVDLLTEEAAQLGGEQAFAREMPYRMHSYYGRRTELPPWLAGLPAGFSELDDPAGVTQHVWVREVGPRLAVVTQDATLVEERQGQIGILLLAFAALGAYLSVWVGWLLSRRVIAPLQRLADEVSTLPPNPTESVPLAARYPSDELGRLAGAIDQYRKQLADAMRRERAFSADASHELRTPLTIIRGAVEVLRSSNRLPPEAGQRLARIERAVNDMAGLIDGFLLLAEGAPADDVPCALLPLATAAAEAERAANPDPRVVLQVAVPAGAQVRGNARALTVICANLVRNAMRHAPGPVTVRVRGTRLEVADAGSGPTAISPGRGLSIVERLCERHGWRFGIVHDDDGTCASVEFGADLTDS